MVDSELHAWKMPFLILPSEGSRNCWKTKSETMKKLAEGLGVRDTLEDLCKRDPLCRLAELGRKGKKEEDPPRDRVIPKNKWCEYLANQATEGLGSTMWMKYKECNLSLIHI